MPCLGTTLILYLIKTFYNFSNNIYIYLLEKKNIYIYFFLLFHAARAKHRKRLNRIVFIVD